MGAVLVSNTIARARLDLVDEDAVTWTDDDLVEYYNEAVRTIVGAKPDSNVVEGDIDLVAGTHQQLPEGGTAIFDITENVTGARRVTLVDGELLDETSRFWPAGAQSADAIHWTADPRDKTRFRVYPPNDGTGAVVGSYAAVPAEVHLYDSNPLADIYEPAIFMLVLSGAYRRNTLRQDLGKSEGYRRQAYNMLGLSAQSQLAVAPRVSESQGS
jgi:hypothetical protein